MEEKKSGFVRILEGIITFVILLVLVQTFLDDFAVIAGWSAQVQDILKIASFAFDLFFTLEFLIRFYNALTARQASVYFFAKLGWVDFIAALPLLIFSSGPAMLGLLLGFKGAVDISRVGRIVKLTKIIRIARVLRLLRILKIFKNIKYAESNMAQRHTTMIITSSVTLVVIALFGYIVMTQSVGAFDYTKPVGLTLNEAADRVSTYYKMHNSPIPVEYIDKNIVRISDQDKEIYASIPADVLAKMNPDSVRFETIEAGTLSIIFNITGYYEIIKHEDDVRQSWQSLFFFGLILVIILFYLIFYSPHFAITISDPIHIMKRGMSEKSYNLQVKIPQLYEEDDIFKLAKLYNEEFLPLKDRVAEDSAPSALQVDDIKDILG